ncbi:MAG: T9SS type A sorting domain-containing protein [Bacteroidota bacterium]
MHYYKLLMLLVLIIASSPKAECQTTFFKTYGDKAQDHYDIGNAVIQTENGGYVAAGVTGMYSEPGSPMKLYGDVYLLKTNEYGDTLWTKKYGNPDLREIAYSMCSTIDGGFMLSAYGSEQLWLIKTDSQGDSLWSKKYPAGIGYCIQRTNDNCYIITGGNYPAGIYLLKINSDGDTLWMKFYDGIDGWSVQQTSDDGYIIAGFKKPTEGIWLIKTDSRGDSLWTKIYSCSILDEPYSICETNDGGYFVTGAYTSKDCEGCELELHIWLLKTDSSGDTTWTKKIDMSNWDLAYKGRQTRDGGYIIAGETVVGYKNYIYMAKLDSSGNIEWSNPLIGEDYDQSRAFDIIETADGVYIITGDSHLDLCLVKVNNKGQLTDVKDEKTIIPTDYTLLQNYPNPFNPGTQISFQISERGLVSITIYDILGKEVITLLNEEKEQGSYTLNWAGKDKNGKMVSSGIYLCRLQSGSLSLCKKMALIR